MASFFPDTVYNTASLPRRSDYITSVSIYNARWLVARKRRRGGVKSYISAQFTRDHFQIETLRLNVRLYRAVDVCRWRGVRSFGGRSAAMSLFDWNLLTCLWTYLAAGKRAIRRRRWTITVQIHRNRYETRSRSTTVCSRCNQSTGKVMKQELASTISPSTRCLDSTLLWFYINITTLRLHTVNVHDGVV